MKGWRIGALPAGAVALLATLGMPGTALTAATTGHEHFTIIQSSQSGGSMDATGAFNARGTAMEGPSNNGTGTSTFVLQNGTFKVTHTNDPGEIEGYNPATCVATFRGGGDYTIDEGKETGAWKGISGHGDDTFHGRLGLDHTTAGCGNNPISGVVVIEAGAPLNFG